jgi:hypothetical protein
MTYELWDLVSRNMIDWFESLNDAVEAVKAYSDADEADTIMLLVHNDAANVDSRCLTGAELVDWLQRNRDQLRHTA